MRLWSKTLNRLLHNKVFSNSHGVGFFHLKKLSRAKLQNTCGNTRDGAAHLMCFSTSKLGESLYITVTVLLKLNKVIFFKSLSETSFQFE
jgi:hypothetical protein